MSGCGSVGLNKRGNFSDIGEVLKLVAVFMFVAVMVLAFINQFDLNIQSTSVVGAEAKEASENFKDSSFTGLDVLFILGLTIFVVFSIVMARMIPSSPKYIIIAFVMLIALPLVSMFIENVWDSFKSSSSYVVSAVSNLTFLPFVCDHLVVFTIVYSFLVAISLLTKDEGGIYNG